MKKYILLILVCFAFFSCKEENAELRDGRYTIEINAKYKNSDGVVYQSFKHSDYVEIIKIDKDKYGISTCYSQEISDKGVLRIYNEEEIEGDYVYSYTSKKAKIKGTLKGIVNGDNISGDFKGTYLIIMGPPLMGSSKLVTLEEGSISIKYESSL